jgi:hypothetical protein
MRVAMIEGSFPADRSTDPVNDDCGETKSLNKSTNIRSDPDHPAVIDVHDESRPPWPVLGSARSQKGKTEMRLHVVTAGTPGPNSGLQGKCTCYSHAVSSLSLRYWLLGTRAERSNDGTATSVFVELCSGSEQVVRRLDLRVSLELCNSGLGCIGSKWLLASNVIKVSNNVPLVRGWSDVQGVPRSIEERW